MPGVCVHVVAIAEVWNMLCSKGVQWNTNVHSRRCACIKVVFFFLPHWANENLTNLPWCFMLCYWNIWRLSKMRVVMVVEGGGGVGGGGGEMGIACNTSGNSLEKCPSLCKSRIDAPVRYFGGLVMTHLLIIWCSTCPVHRSDESIAV